MDFVEVKSVKAKVKKCHNNINDCNKVNTNKIVIAVNHDIYANMRMI